MVYRSSYTFNVFAGVYFLEDKTVNFIQNIKKGDIILTDVGSAVVMRETRAKWFYLFKNKLIGIRKSEFWEMVDMGKLQISYVSNKKYRTKQRKFRTLDLTKSEPGDDHESMFEDFIRFARPPLNVAYNAYIDINLDFFIDKANQLGLEYEIDRARFGTNLLRMYDA